MVNTFTYRLLFIPMFPIIIFQVIIQIFKQSIMLFQTYIQENR